MGSYISCTSCNSVASSTVKVILWNGSVQELQRRIKAAELMLDNPQHFVCHANGLQIGRRISPLTADEDLDLGHIYFLLPMPKLQSVLSGADLASLSMKANSIMKPAKRRSSGAIIVPLFGHLMRSGRPQKMKKNLFLLEERKQSSGAQEEELPVPKLNLEDDIPELLTRLAQRRMNASKSWKPKLETINEF